MALSICRTYLSDVPIDDVKKKPYTNILELTTDNRINFQNHFIFLLVNRSGHL